MPKIEWTHAIYDRADGSEKCSLLIAIIAVEGLPSPAIFDSKANVVELTTGRGYGFASEDFKNEAEAQARYVEFTIAVDEYINNISQSAKRVKFLNKSITNKEEPAQ